MYKLVVISGPTRGSSYDLSDGELSMGRSPNNRVILASNKVSKQHCLFVVQAEEVTVKDLGSSNGTFVNGALSKLRKLKVGDRVSLGEFVLELVNTSVHVGPSPGFPQVAGVGVAAKNLAQGHAGSMAPSAPQDLPGKILWNFEQKVMPIFYGFSLKYEWRMICAAGFAAFVFGNLAISVYPLLESSRSTVIKETSRRARYMAREIAEHNSQFLAARTETKADIGMAENAEGVRLAVLLDLDNRIIAPGSKLNQYLASGGEANVAIRAREAFRAGRETGYSVEVGSDTIVAIEPVKVVSPTQGKNVIVAMALVSIDTSLATPDFGEMGLIYSETLIFTGLLGALILIILYRMTLKPFEVLNEDMDRALKGEMAQVTHDFKIEELKPLWDIINSAIQRIPKSGDQKEEALNLAGSIEDFIGPLKALGEVSGLGLLVFDSERKVVFLNSIFEELSGVRSDSALGQSMDQVARDQSMAAFCGDMLDRVSVGGEGVSEDYDFSGISYKVQVVAFGSPGTQAKCYAMTAKKAEG